jgi:hypothetical protein
MNKVVVGEEFQGHVEAREGSSANQIARVGYFTER